MLARTAEGLPTETLHARADGAHLHPAPQLMGRINFSKGRDANYVEPADAFAFEKSPKRTYSGLGLRMVLRG